MISSLTGTLVAKSPTEIVVDVNGVGYTLLIPLSTFQSLCETGARLTIQTHLHVREDALVLFGFATARERDMFRLLISVSGIGPRTGQAMLSGMSVDELTQNIAGAHAEALTAIPGVGRKTAERIILELRDRIGRTVAEAVSSVAGPTSAEVRNETLTALTSLGYARPAAEKAIRAALNESGMASLTVEQLIKLSLRHIAGH